MFKKIMAILLAYAVLFAVLPVVGADSGVSIDDAYVNFDSESNKWTFGTSLVEKTVQLNGTGQFLLTGFVNKLTGRDYIQNGAKSDEFAIKVGTGSASPASGEAGGWVLAGWSENRGALGELEIKIVLRKGMLEVTRNYRVLPETGVIEEWSDFKNISGSSQQFSELRVLRARLMTAEAANVDLYYMSGDKNSSKGYYKMQAPVDMGKASDLNLGTYTGNGGDLHQPFGALYNRETEEGVFMTWDYTGTWTAKFGNNSGKIFSQVSTAGGKEHEFSVSDGETVSSPLARMGVFAGDLDDMGNAISDYQYRYKWKYTNEKYMNLVRFGGYGYSNDILFDKTNLNRYLGGDMLWIDDGWQNYLGDWEWNGTRPVNEYQDYLKLSNMTLGMWLVPWGVINGSDLAAEHPEWCINLVDKKGGLKVELPEVQEHIRNMLNARQQEFGTFMLKTDFNQNKSVYSRATAVMEIIKNFKEDNPQAGLTLCSDGGGLLNPGTAQYSEIIPLQDGTPDLDDGYWVSMLYPVDKIMTANGRAPLGAYTKSNRAIMSGAFTVATTSALGQTGNLNISDAEMELIRQDVDLYRWLRTQGVMGRFVKVYRPETTSENKYYFMQKMSPDASKGYMTVRFDESFAGEELVMYPKGLEADMTYTVSSLEGGMARVTKTGTELMSEGIALTMKVGEVIFFNLENRPGNADDTEAPTEPAELSQNATSHLGFDGMELKWEEACDNSWLSYYEIFKNGKYYSKVSTGTYYFDEKGTPNDVYEMRAVDGNGNKSATVKAAGAPDTYPEIDDSFKPYYEIWNDGSTTKDVVALQAGIKIADSTPDGNGFEMRTGISQATGKASDHQYVQLVYENISVPENAVAIAFWFGQEFEMRNPDCLINDPDSYMLPKFMFRWRPSGTKDFLEQPQSSEVFKISTDDGKVYSCGMGNATNGTPSQTNNWVTFKNGYVIIPVSLLAKNGFGEGNIDFRIEVTGHNTTNGNLKYMDKNGQIIENAGKIYGNTVLKFDNFGFITDMEAFLADCGEVSGKVNGKNTYINSSVAYKLGVLPSYKNAAEPSVNRTADGVSIEIPAVEGAAKYVISIYDEAGVYLAGVESLEASAEVKLDVDGAVKVQAIAMDENGNYLSVSTVKQIKAKPILSGDVNNDGTVDIKDLVRLKEYLAGTYTDIVKENAELDGNTDRIDAGDLAALRKLLLRL